MSGYACRYGGIGGVDGDAVGCAVGIRVLDDHLWEVKYFSALGGYGSAYQTTENVSLRVAGQRTLIEWRIDPVPGIAYHKAHLLRGDILSSDDQVALILTILRVKNDDEFPPSYQRVATVSDCFCVASALEQRETSAGRAYSCEASRSRGFKYIRKASIESSMESNWRCADCGDGI